MRKPTRTYPITLESLTAYQQSAMRNAVALVEDGASAPSGRPPRAGYTFSQKQPLRRQARLRSRTLAKGRNLAAPEIGEPA